MVTKDVAWKVEYFFLFFFFFNQLSLMSFNVYTIYNVKDEKLRVKRGLYFLKFGIKNFELVSFFLL